MVATIGHGLGRLVEKDLRDLDYLLAADGPLPSFSVPMNVRRPPERLYDQGADRTAVACALLTALGAIGRRISPETLHAEALGRDDLAEPISLRDGCKALQRLGLIGRYLWTYEVDEISRWIVATGGPVVIGSDFYDWMYHPDPETGLVARPHGVAGRVVGGNAYVLFGVDTARHLAEIQPAFGPSWGGWLEGDARRYDGCARIKLEDLGRLFKGNGEAVVLEY